MEEKSDVVLRKAVFELVRLNGDLSKTLHGDLELSYSEVMDYCEPIQQLVRKIDEILDKRRPKIE